MLTNQLSFFSSILGFWFVGILGSVSLCGQISCLLLYTSTHHSPESFTHLKTGTRAGIFILESGSDNLADPCSALHLFKEMPTSLNS